MAWSCANAILDTSETGLPFGSAEKIALILTNLPDAGFLRSPVMKQNAREGRQFEQLRTLQRERITTQDSVAGGESFEPLVQFLF
jgi:hypothetical protein